MVAIRETIMVRGSVLVTCAVLLSGLPGCSQVPILDVAPTVRMGAVTFDVRRSGVNGILGFVVSDESGNTLWAISTSYEKGREIIYGQLPTGGNMAAEQTFPPNNRPPVDIRGKTVIVKITYQYDANFAASMGQYEKKVHVPE